MGLAMAESENSTADPTVMDEALAAELAAVLGVSVPEEAEILSASVAGLRDWYIAVALHARPRLRPSVAKRRLENIDKALQQRRRPRRRAVINPNVQPLLKQGGVERLEKLIADHGRDRARQKGARAKAAEAIEAENFGVARHYTTKAIEIVRSLVEQQRGRPGVSLGRIADTAKTDFVCRLAKLHLLFTGERPTRSGKRGLTRFERFVELALGDLTGNTGPALAMRWRRHEVREHAVQNGVCSSSTAA